MKLLIMQFFQLRVIVLMPKYILPKLLEVRALIRTTMIQSVRPATGRRNAHKCQLMQRLSPMLLFFRQLSAVLYTALYLGI
jgi:hypothetical protein